MPNVDGYLTPVPHTRQVEGRCMAVQAEPDENRVFSGFESLVNLKGEA